MFLLGDDARLVISASDLRTASDCEFALVRQLDVLLGRADKVEDPRDPTPYWIVSSNRPADLARALAAVRPGA